MNKVYKIIWSKARNCYVVVSEMAKRNGKTSSGLNKKIIAAFLAAGTVLSVNGSAWANYTNVNITQNSDTQVITQTAYGTASGTDSIAIGASADKKATTYGDYSIAIGGNAQVGTSNYWWDKSNNSIAIGNSAKIDRQSNDSTVIGKSASVGSYANDSTVIGSSASVGYNAYCSTVIGSGAYVGQYASYSTAFGKSASVGQSAYSSTAIGTSASVGQSAYHSTAIGQGASVGQSAYSSTAIGQGASVGQDAYSSTAIGAGANVADGVNGSTAFGSNASVSVEGGVALGSNSVAATASGAAGYDVTTGAASTDSSPVWKATAGAVSIGAEAISYGGLTLQPGITRQITNVAAGANDTDAVNVAQLKKATTHFIGVNSNSATETNYRGEGASGPDAIAVGSGASATQLDSIAIGSGLVTSAEKKTIKVTYDSQNDRYYYTNPDSGYSAELGISREDGYSIYSFIDENGNTVKLNSANAIRETITEQGAAMELEFVTPQKTGTQATGHNSISLGAAASASAENAIAIGGNISSSTQTLSKLVRKYDLDGDSETFTYSKGGAEQWTLKATLDEYGDYTYTYSDGSHTDVATYQNPADGRLYLEYNSETGDYTTPIADFDVARVMMTNVANTSAKMRYGEDGFEVEHHQVTDFSANVDTTKASGANAIAVGLAASATGNNAIAIGQAKVTGGMAYELKQANDVGGFYYEKDGEKVYVTHVPGRYIVSQETDSQGNVTTTYADNDSAGTVTVDNEGKFVSGSIKVTDESGQETEYALNYMPGELGYYYENEAGEKVYVSEAEIALNGSKTLDENGNLVSGSYRKTNPEVEEAAASASGDDAIAFGTAANAAGTNAIALGHGAQVLNKGEGDAAVDSANSIAIGNGATITGSNSIAIGNGHQVKGDGNAVIGDPNYIDGNNNFIFANNVGSENAYAQATGAVVIGHHEDGNEDEFGNQSVSVGYKATASEVGSVALGSESVAGRAASPEFAGYDPATGEQSTKTSDIVWTANRAAVSVGASHVETDTETGSKIVPDITRQITGVAAGSEDTDAVNVAQLKAVADTIGTPVHYYSVNDTNRKREYIDPEDTSNYNNDGATGVRALAAGLNAKADGMGTSAVGTGAEAYGETSVALGYGAVAGRKAELKTNGSYAFVNHTRETNLSGTPNNRAIAIGFLANASNNESIAMGTEAEADYYAIAIGTEANAVGYSVVIGNKAGNSKYANDSTVIGYEANGNGYRSTAVGYESLADESGSLAIGSDSKALGRYSSAIGVSTAVGEDSVAIGGDSVAYGDGSLAALGGTTGSGTVERDYTSETVKYKAQTTVNAQGAVAIGEGAAALGTRSYAVGKEAQAKMENTIAFGNASLSSGKNGTAIGSGIENTSRTYDAVVITDNGVTGEETSKYIKGATYTVDESGQLTISGGTEYVADENENVTVDGRTFNIWDLVEDENSVSEELYSSYDAGTEVSTEIALRVNKGNTPTTASGENSAAFGNAAVASGKNSVAIGSAKAVEKTKDVWVYEQEELETSKDDGSYTELQEVYYYLDENNNKVFLSNKEVEQLDYENAEEITDPETGETTYKYKYTVKETSIEKDGPLAEGENAIAIGTGARVAEAGKDAVAIGTDAASSMEGSVALGSESVAGRDNVTNTTQYTGYNPSINKKGTENTVNSGAAWMATRNAVSVGDADQDVTRQITGVAAGSEDTDAVNVAQLKAARVEVVAGNDNVTVTPDTTKGYTQYSVSVPSTFSVYSGGSKVSSMDKLDVSLDFGDGLKAEEVQAGYWKVGLDEEYIQKNETFKGPKGDKGEDGAPGKDGTSVTITNTESTETGTTVTFSDGNEITVANGADGKDGAAGKNGLNGKNGANGAPGKDGTDGKDGKDGANGKDGVNGKDGAPGKDGVDGKDGVNGKDGAPGKDGVDGKDGKDGVDGKNGADGKSAYEIAKDNGFAGTEKEWLDSLKGGSVDPAEIQRIDNSISAANSRIDRLDSRVKKVGAGAAALAALHAEEFDPDDKLSFAAGVGNYRGETAAAIGMFYRPTDRVMFSMGSTVGNGENMVNAGISFALDRGFGKTSSRAVMSKEITELRNHIAKQDEQIAELKALVNQLANAKQQEVAVQK